MPLNLFLSSTVRDLEEHRLEISDACRKADTVCFLSEEDWSGGYDDTVASCEQRVLSADAFLLIVAHFYGSVPPGRDRSITHIEFDGARKRWAGNKFPPMAVMMPKPGTDIDRDLRKVARALLRKDKADRKQHDQSLKTFRDTVAGGWRRVKQFTSVSDLREWVIADCKDWRGLTPMAAAKGLVVGALDAAEPQVTDEQLGAIGRDPQILASRSVLARLADYPDVPALALVVPGDESAGQRAGALRLIKVALRHYTTRQRIARLPVTAPNAAALSSWIGQSMGFSDASGIQTPEQLATRVATELKRQSLCFAIDRIGDVPGGVAGFRDGFWAPFYQALRTLRATQQFTNRLVAIVTDYAGDSPTDRTALVSADKKGVVADYTRLVRLPLLDEFDRDVVLTWFDEMDIPDTPAGRRAALADRALLGSTGLDPNPLRVFERLRGEMLWPPSARGDA